MKLTQLMRPLVLGGPDKDASRYKLLSITVAKDHSRRISGFTWLIVGGMVLAAAAAVFGLPPFGIPMPTWAIGIVTPTCGLTRASAALARGDLALAWAFNPAAFVLAGIAAITLARAAIGKLTGHWIDITIMASGLLWAALILIWWANQQLNADFIIHGTL